MYCMKKLVDSQSTLSVPVQDFTSSLLLLVLLSLLRAHMGTVGVILPSKAEVLWFTSQHIQALHHRGSHNIDLEVALCVTMVLGLRSALRQCLSVDVLLLKWWRVGPLKRERKNTKEVTGNDPIYSRAY